ncbi:plastocyanin [Sinomonas atrocyanea]|uniref:cupredoxin domain-containing protein n=1 Tax=Sinomonas atrocyanea TaxID=37927 RepID=UPI00277E2CC3|nr:cupredoxin domain-containing protein [Sinomonas atrocyanea]MDP9882925.1 plastocyanin [Sinomonas atrocyanea]
MELSPRSRRRLAGLALLFSAVSLGTTACSGAAMGSAGSGTAQSAPAATASMEPGMAMGPSQATSAEAVTIHISSSAYSDPGPVAPGATVTVMNMDAQAHTVTADGGAFKATAPAGRSVAFTAPATPGTYPFHCEYHADMHGTLTVR